MNNTLKTLTSLALLAGTAQLVHAHAGFKDQITEGTVKTWNAVSIGHGCNTNEGGEANGQPHKDVIAISAIFPNSPNFSDVVIRKSNGKPAVAEVKDKDGNITTKGVAGFTAGEEDVLPNLANDIVGSTADTTPLKATLSVITSGGTLFANTIPVVDGKGNLRGWQGWGDATSAPNKGAPLLESAKKADGSDISTTGLSPFGINGFQFQPTSCAKTLKIRVAVANWCAKGASSYNDPARVDLWIGHTTPKFKDQVVMPSSDPNSIFWTTLTVNRDLAKNPLPGTTGFDVTTGSVINRKDPGWDAGNGVKSDKVSCAAATDYDTVYIEPSDNDIDTYMPISAAKYPKGTSGALYWPTK
ncbi:MAG: hypothetical protein PHN45_05520 [Methylococcales bacterium]|nr:hypothetical protein [Methylococcales bacterium]